jgi:beta-glucosidase
MLLSSIFHAWRLQRWNSNKIFFNYSLLILLLCNLSSYSQTTPPNADGSIDQRVEALLKRMTLEEKVEQLQSQLLFPEKYKDRNFTVGHFRNIAHFMHKIEPASAGACAAAINEDTRQSIAASRFGIPGLQHGEALHGAQWGMATVFPQCIGLAASFDDSLVFRVGEVVASELRAVGVRQVYAPVINIARDPRWGRMQETYGEDVWLTSRMGVAYTKALQRGGVISTLKHLVDNYGDGGHDSYASDRSWRSLREVYLEPFRVCVTEGGRRYHGRL